MLTIDGKRPFIILDEFLDIEGFLKLKDEFSFMMSTCMNECRTGIWSAGGHSPGKHHNIFHEKDLLYYVHQRAQTERATNPDLDAKLKYFEDTKDRTGLARFYKLKYGAYDPYTLLNLRTTTMPVYSSDARFTKEEWDTYKWIPAVERFPKIKKFIEELPLDEIGAVTVFYNEHCVPIGYHKDYNYFPLERGDQPDSFPHRQEFIWLRFDLDRAFNILEIDDNGVVTNTLPVEGHSAYFHHHNWHGNFDSIPYSSLTVKVEGKFKPELRKLMGIDHLDVY